MCPGRREPAPVTRLADTAAHARTDRAPDRPARRRRHRLLRGVSPGRHRDGGSRAPLLAPPVGAHGLDGAEAAEASLVIDARTLAGWSDRTTAPRASGGPRDPRGTG